MQRLILTALATFLSLSYFSLAPAADRANPEGAENQEAIRAQYLGTPDMPDWIVFSAFVGMIKDLEPSQGLYDLLAQALGLSADNETIPTIKERIKLFDDVRADIETDIATTAFQMLCTGDIRSRAQEAIYQAMNDVDDVRESIVTKHYTVTMSALPAAERQALQNYLNDMKGSTSYTKVDNRLGRLNEGLEARQIIDRRCNALIADHPEFLGYRQ